MNKRNPFVLLAVLMLVTLLTAGLVFATWQGSGVLGDPPILPPAPSSQPSAINLEPRAYLPVTIGEPASQEPWINTQSKNEVRNFYLTEYMASEGVPSGWNGDHAGCNAGTTTAAFKTAVLRRINYFRSMAGIPPVTAFKNDYTSKAQKAALMMSVNNALDHTPPTSWTCYTADGAEAAGSSNLYLGVYGPSAITGYIQDPGGGNYFVGHRRWILYPQTQFMGTGDIPPTSYLASNALWVFDLDNMWGPRPETREEYVAWPPPGYSPYQVVFDRWSFAYAGANFANANISMTKNGNPLSLQKNSIANGYGENTLVWEPNDTFGQAPTSDIVYNVTITNVVINGQSHNFSYQVILFKP
ncbi:MAG: CAP domain-containing protein [Candidatus Promineifilaceae bacterium]